MWSYKSIHFSVLADLKDMKANIGPNSAVVWMGLLIRMHIQQADRSVSLQAAFLTEGQQSRRPTDLQIMRQEESDGFADQWAGLGVVLGVTQLQGSGTQLQADLDPFTSDLDLLWWNKIISTTVVLHLPLPIPILEVWLWHVKYSSCRTSVVTSLMKGKMALTLVAEEASDKHSARKPSLEGWALRCSRLQMKSRSL